MSEKCCYCQVENSGLKCVLYVCVCTIPTPLLTKTGSVFENFPLPELPRGRRKGKSLRLFPNKVAEESATDKTLYNMTCQLHNKGILYTVITNKEYSSLLPLGEPIASGTIPFIIFSGKPRATHAVGPPIPHRINSALFRNRK